MERELEGNQKDYHWKIYGINEEKNLITTIYLFETMEEALAQKQEVDIIADLKSDANDTREYEFYEVMVDQSLLCEAPILMDDLGTKDFEQLFYSEGSEARVLR
jgi:Uri superfamily endonuclease